MKNQKSEYSLKKTFLKLRFQMKYESLNINKKFTEIKLSNEIPKCLNIHLKLTYKKTSNKNAKSEYS